MPVLALDHVQLAMPPGREAEARAFYAGLLGLGERDKPEPLRARGGCWFERGPVKVHLGVEEGFVPARKAHPAFRVDDLAALAARLAAAGHSARTDAPLDGCDRFHVDDPFGNRIELMQARPRAPVDAAPAPCHPGPTPAETRAMTPQDPSPVDAPADDRDLVLNRLVRAAPGALYRCWTEPELLRRWFAPEPWTVPVAELDLRVGGASLVVMRGPDGTEYPNRGVYLDLVPGERIVFTDAYLDAWTPSPKPFMTVVLTFAAHEAGWTRYAVRVRHWTAADRESHEAMGFHQGWGRCADQLALLAETL